MGKDKDKAALLQGTLDLLVLKTVETMGPLHGWAVAKRAPRGLGKRRSYKLLEPYSIFSSVFGRPSGVRSKSVHSGSTVPRCRGSWPASVGS